jgi:hypothetical protein
MNEDRIRDPKIMPPPNECVMVEFEVSKEEGDSLREPAKKAGCWSLGEFLRMVTADYVATRKKPKGKHVTNIVIEFPEGEKS